MAEPVASTRYQDVFAARSYLGFGILSRVKSVHLSVIPVTTPDFRSLPTLAHHGQSESASIASLRCLSHRCRQSIRNKFCATPYRIQLKMGVPLRSLYMRMTKQLPNDWKAKARSDSCRSEAMA